MRAMLGLVGLVVVLAIVGVLARKQTSALRNGAPGNMPAAAANAASEPLAVQPGGNVQQQSQQIQQQVEGILQQARPMPDEEGAK
ncbi:MAG: hypothetical protein LWW96_17195 [Acidovorax sp.]|uniref:hypothetical protein n=1 Tax=Acidovorax sp. TaxID=1872122 RepID=UPI0025B93BB8|nr:hypothetical protein [Acidovorax sp.]MCE1193886.1 hypothetical protein [Acidovorax sp.]